MRQAEAEKAEAPAKIEAQTKNLNDLNAQIAKLTEEETAAKAAADQLKAKTAELQAQFDALRA